MKIYVQRFSSITNKVLKIVSHFIQQGQSYSGAIETTLFVLRSSLLFVALMLDSEKCRAGSVLKLNFLR